MKYIYKILSFGEENPDSHGIQDTLKSSHSITSNFYFLIFLVICTMFSFFSPYSFFLYVVYSCVCTWVCRYTCMCGTLRFLLVFSSVLHLIFWEENLGMFLKITVLARIDSHWASGICLSPFFQWYVLDMTYANIPDF